MVGFSVPLVRGATATVLRNKGNSPARVFVRFHSILGRQGVSQRGLSVAAQATQEQEQLESWEQNCTGVDETHLRGQRADWWFTGKHPRELTADLADKQLKSLPQPTLENVTENAVREYFDNTWTLTEVQFSALQGEEAFYKPPYHHLRHPMIFYYGHTATFYTNKLNVAGLGNAINPYFEDIFEVGVDEMSWDDMSKNVMQWPGVLEVQDYRRQTYEQVQEVIDRHISGSGDNKVDMNHPLWSLFMAFEHDRIHLETSSVLLREMPIHQLRKPEYWPELHPSARSPLNGVMPSTAKPNPMVAVGGGTVRIGKQADFPTYGWDNEYGQRTVDVPAFEASAMMVSNAEYYEFVVAGGYRSREFWTEDGWGWRTFRNAKWPYFWQQAGPAGSHEYRLRATFEEVDMPWDWPVNVNKHEATAFCNWKAAQGDQWRGLRLTTEAEHMLLRDEPMRHPVADPSHDPALVHGGATMSTEGGCNLNLAYGSESPVDAHPPNKQGFHDVMGNAWEWAEDDFNALDGFKVHEYYDDFSSPCFDGEHNMILGGSFMSSGDAGANLHCRYHFRPHFLQHSGFRYVKPSRAERFPAEGIAKHLSDKSGNVAPSTGGGGGKSNRYETEELIDQYMALHYGQSEPHADETIRAHKGRPDFSLNFPERCASVLSIMTRQLGPQTAETGSSLVNGQVLDIGCAVGGTSLQLSRYFKRVVGIDYSHGFVEKAKECAGQASNRIKFSVPVEGDLRRESVQKKPVHFFKLNCQPEFYQADACNLSEDDLANLDGPFDAILMANLICRLPDPDALLNRLPELTKPGGIVLTVSPFSWLEEFTPREKWFQQGDKLSEQVLEEKMEALGFSQEFSQDMPLIIREHERKYQYIVSHAAAFRKKE